MEDKNRRILMRARKNEKVFCLFIASVAIFRKGGFYGKQKGEH